MSQKDLKIPQLLDIYGELLTDKQRLLTGFYYDDDLSLGEISENEGISRQGARAFIKKAEEKLCEYENALHILENSENEAQRNDEIKKLCDRIICGDDIVGNAEKIKRLLS